MRSTPQSFTASSSARPPATSTALFLIAAPLASDPGADARALHQNARRSLAEQPVEIADGLQQSLLERHFRLPAQALARDGDVGTALPRVVGGQRTRYDLRARARQIEH